MENGIEQKQINHNRKTIRSKTVRAHNCLYLSIYCLIVLRIRLSEEKNEKENN